MYLVLIAWGYVVLMAAIAEALSPHGSVAGAVGTVVWFGVLPMTLLAYVAGSPLRRRARARAEQARLEAADMAGEACVPAAAEPSPAVVIQTVQTLLPDRVSVSDQAGTDVSTLRVVASAPPDDSRHAPAAAQHGGVAPVRKED